MRKIESDIIRAIGTVSVEDRMIKLSARDSVACGTTDNNVITYYYLHGHAIFALSVNQASGERVIILSDCGWRSATTKSRLNAILASVLPGYRIHQKDFSWYIADNKGMTRPFFNGIQYAI